MHKKLVSICCMLTAICYVLFLFSCATTPELPPPPPKYVYEKKEVPASLNSLWYDRASLYEDVKAQRLNDLVTIRVIESISGSGKADTNASKESSLEAEVTDVFGAPLDFNLSNFWGKGKTFSPTASGSMQSEFKGSGETTREGRLIGTITAKVVEVLPNGNLVLESRKEITINREKQFFVLRGIVRPFDIAPDNTILSTKVADAQVYFVGKGVVQDKQGPGWLVQILDKVWPF